MPKPSMLNKIMSTAKEEEGVHAFPEGISLKTIGVRICLLWSHRTAHHQLRYGDSPSISPEQDYHIFCRSLDFPTFSLIVGNE